MDEGISQEEYDKLMRIKQDSDPNALYAENMREEKIANVIAQLDPQNLLDDIEHRLRGEKFNKLEQQWEAIGDERISINEKLISRFMSFLGAVLNQNTTLSNYSLNEINNRMELVIEYIRDDLTDNDVEYNLEGKYTEMTRIGMIICETVSSVFRRALNGMESRRIFASLKVTESLTTAPQRQTMKEALQFWK